MPRVIAPRRNALFRRAHAALLISSFYRLTGRHLLETRDARQLAFQALEQAPFAVVSHGTEQDPIFNYGNKTALSLFEMSWDSFTQLPSKLSAEPATRAERDALLARVDRFGFIDDYTGVRISSSGRRFFVDSAVVWNLLDASGHYHGQAAALFQVRPYAP